MKKINLKTKIIASLVVLFLFVWGLDKFFDVYTLRNPIQLKFQSPVIKRYQDTKKQEKSKDEPKKSNISPIPKTDKEIINSYKHKEILWKIYGLESTWGRNDNCKDQGKFNGYGYANQCFESFNEVTGKVNNWIEKRLIANSGNLTETLCYYNLGIAQQVNCFYYQSYLAL